MKIGAKVIKKLNTNKLNYKIMKTIHEITINSTISNEYASKITLVEVAGIIYYVITQTNHKGVINEYEQRCETYKEALRTFIEEVAEYANHTTLMTL